MSRRSSKKYHSAKCLRSQPEFSAIDKSRNFFILGLTFLILLFMGASIFYISTHINAVDIGYKINEELHRKQQLIEENKLLRLKIAQLKSPTRIEAEAKERFNLSVPDPEQIVYLSTISQSNLLMKLAENSSEKPPSPKPSKLSKEIKSSKKTKTLAKTNTKTSQKKVKAKTETPTTVFAKKEPQSKPKRIIVAKIIRRKDTLEFPSVAPKSNSKGLSAKKTKEALPATLIDTMP